MLGAIVGDIVGSIAEARWGVLWHLDYKIMRFLPQPMQNILRLIYPS